MISNITNTSNEILSIFLLSKKEKTAKIKKKKRKEKESTCDFRSYKEKIFMANSSRKNNKL